MYDGEGSFLYKKSGWFEENSEKFCIFVALKAAEEVRKLWLKS